MCFSGEQRALAYYFQGFCLFVCFGSSMLSPSNFSVWHLCGQPTCKAKKMEQLWLQIDKGPPQLHVTLLLSPKMSLKRAP